MNASMNPSDEFFRETTLRICGSLEISTAIGDVFTYFKHHFPIIGLSLTIRDQELGALRRIALATDHQEEYPVEIQPMGENLWAKVQQMAATLREPFIITTDQDPVIRQLALLFKLRNKRDLVLPLWMDGSLQGALNLRGEQEGCFSQHHLDMVRDITRPFTIALANAIAHDKIRRYSELLLKDNQRLTKKLGHHGEETIVGGEGGLRNVMQLVGQVAPLANTVLLLGETGTGKELIAGAIHASSTYKAGPFVKVNCGAIPEHLIDSELFGHEKGAFTGAIATKQGRFEQAIGGTIFLDEIGELPLQAQIRLLRVLQNREIDRVGGNHPVPVDIRVIAATHRNLENMVQEQSFREDLWFRLNVFPIIIPPLRQRREDIPALIRHFISSKAREIGITKLPILMPGALARMQSYHWPGNVRELENMVERELILHRDGCLPFEHLPPTASAQASSSPHETPQETLDTIMSRYIIQVLQHCDGRISGTGGAAEILGLHPNTLRARMKKLGIRFGRQPLG